MNATAAHDKVLAARESLRSRFAALEDRVTGSVDDVREAVTGTVDHTSENVRGLVQTATTSLSEIMDVRARVREHPWGGTALALAAGAVLGLVTRGSTTTATVKAAVSRTPHETLLGSLWDAARRELKTLGESVIVTASESLKAQIAELAEPVEPSANRIRQFASANGHAAFRS